jgi:hypothetical protein
MFWLFKNPNFASQPPASGELREPFFRIHSSVALLNSRHGGCTPRRYICSASGRFPNNMLGTRLIIECARVVRVLGVPLNRLIHTRG